MAKDRTMLINIINLKKDDKKLLQFAKEMVKHHKKIDYHMQKIDVQLGYIDDAIVRLDLGLDDKL